MIRVLIVDDHAAFRQPLAFMLDREPDMTVVGQAGSVQEARQLLRGVDVAIIDLDLDDGNGMQLIPALRQANMLGTVLVVTAHANRVQMAHAIERGASAVLHKSASIAEIVDAVRRLSMGETLVSPEEVIELLQLASRRREEDRAAEAKIASLTARERDVLAELAGGLSDKEIAQRLGIGGETVRTHMVKILSKLGVSSRLQALIFALRHGVVEIGPD